MIITTSCGLWRYLIGDTVQFTSKNPYKFVITDRQGVGLKYKADKNKNTIAQAMVFNRH